MDLELDNVIFLGQLLGEELKQQYKDCIATVLPCNYFENMPISIIESFIHGKPVIGSNLGGIPESGFRGLWLPAGLDILRQWW